MCFQSQTECISNVQGTFGAVSCDSVCTLHLICCIEYTVVIFNIKPLIFSSKLHCLHHVSNMYSTNPLEPLPLSSTHLTALEHIWYACSNHRNNHSYKSYSLSLLIKVATSYKLCLFLVKTTKTLSFHQSLFHKSDKPSNNGSSSTSEWFLHQPHWNCWQWCKFNSLSWPFHNFLSPIACQFNFASDSSTKSMIGKVVYFSRF